MLTRGQAKDKMEANHNEEDYRAILAP